MVGWNISKQFEFGRQTPLYAEDCDADRTRDVWFICYHDDIQKKGGTYVHNYIDNNGENITEIVEPHIGKSHDADRITFVWTRDGYKFLGVYKLTQNGTTRKYKRISEVYPVKD